MDMAAQIVRARVDLVVQMEQMHVGDGGASVAKSKEVEAADLLERGKFQAALAKMKSGE